MKTTLHYLRLMALAFVVICVCHAIWKPNKPRLSIEMPINSATNSVITVNRAETGYHALFIVYDEDSLPPNVTRVGMPSKGTSNLLWQASISVYEGRSVLFTSKTIQLEPSFLVEKRQYFRIAGWNLSKPDHLQISISPNEPCPLGPNPYAAITPGNTFNKANIINETLWMISYVLSAIVGLALILYALVRKRHL